MIPSLLMALFSAFEERRANHILELHPATGPPLSSQGAAGGFYVLRELWEGKRRSLPAWPCAQEWLPILLCRAMNGD